MIFTNTQRSSNKSKTPIKNNTLPLQSPLRNRKQGFKNQLLFSGSNHPQLKLKAKQKFATIYMLQQIYNGLNFNQFQAFPIQNIQSAKKNIQKLYVYLKQQPICPKHQDLLNLYCQTDKQVVCVSCVFKGQHKSHKAKPIDSVQKLLDYQSIRSQQKGKSLVHQLYQIKQQMDIIQKQVQQNYMSISNYTMSIINQAIADLQKIKIDLQRNLGLSYRRTTTILSRYSQCLDKMANLVDFNLQKSSVMNKLAKYLLLKQLNKQSSLLQDLVGKFNQNKILMQQWRKTAKQFQKIFVKKKTSGLNKQDAYVVTQF